jgi:hypothetical protein
MVSTMRPHTFRPVVSELEPRWLLSYAVSVAAFGAKPGTDATVAIQTALNSVPAAGGTVYVPPGLYEVSKTLVIDTNNTVFVGAGSGKSELQLARGVETSVLELGDATHRVQNVAVGGLHIDGNHNGASQLYFGVYFVNGNQVSLSHSLITNFVYIGIWTGAGEDCSNVSIYYNVVSGCGSQDCSFGSVTNAGLVGDVFYPPSQWWGQGGPWGFQFQIDLEPDPHCFDVNIELLNCNFPGGYAVWYNPLLGVVDVAQEWGPVVHAYGINNIVNGRNTGFEWL